MKKLYSVILIIICVFLASCANDVDGKKFKKEYETLNSDHYKVSINKDNPFIYSSIKEINKLVNSKDNFIIFVGQASDNWSRHLAEIIIDSAKDLRIEKIYYIESNDDDLDSFAKSKKVEINIPSIIVFQNGKVKSLYNSLEDSAQNAKEKFNKTYYNKVLKIVNKTLKT